MIISVEGLPGAGKTVTARNLAAGLGWGDARLEQGQDNPLLEDFYSQPHSCSFEVEAIFCLLHSYRWPSALPDCVTDYSYRSLALFAESSLSSFPQRTKELFWELYDHQTRRLTPPDLVLFLDLKSEHLLERMQLRGRQQEAGVTLDYICGIRDVYTDNLDSLGAEVLRLPILANESIQEVSQQCLALAHAHIDNRRRLEFRHISPP
jgi:deoxyadenosine/deoxycytidine kinase